MYTLTTLVYMYEHVYCSFIYISLTIYTYYVKMIHIFSLSTKSLYNNVITLSRLVDGVRDPCIELQYGRLLQLAYIISDSSRLMVFSKEMWIFSSTYWGWDVFICM